MKKIKNKKSSPIQIKTPQSQITALWNSPVSTVLVGFFFFFVFFFLPQSWCLTFLNSLYLLILLKPKPKPICLKLLSQINGSPSLAIFFLVGFCAYGVADLSWWGVRRGFVGIDVVEAWVCGLAWWRVWVCGDQHLWWSFGDGTDQSLGWLVMGYMIVRWLDR